MRERLVLPVQSLPPQSAGYHKLANDVRV